MHVAIIAGALIVAGAPVPAGAALAAITRRRKR